MKKSFKFAGRLAGLAVFATASVSAQAACPTTTPGWARVVAGTDNTTLLFKVAVASNFVSAVQTLANAYLASLGTSSTNYIEICGNSSGTISEEINAHNSADLFSLFLSADEKNANAVSTEGPYGRGKPFPYANGIPVFLLSPAATSADPGSDYPALDYLTVGSGAYAEGTVRPISNKVTINRNAGAPHHVSYLAIGDPELAPYGVAAIEILSEMGFVSPPPLIPPFPYANANTNVTSNCSSLVASDQWICAYRNIDYTLQAIDANRVTAGIVSYGQVCTALNGTAYDPKRYVLFPENPTTQYGILLKSTSTQQTNADNFLNYLGVASPNYTNGFESTWNTWLSGNCYKAI